MSSKLIEQAPYSFSQTHLSTAVAYFQKISHQTSYHASTSSLQISIARMLPLHVSILLPVSAVSRLAYPKLNNDDETSSAGADIPAWPKYEYTDSETDTDLGPVP